MQVYAAEAQAVKLKPEPVEPATAKLEDGSPKLKPEPLQPIAAKHGEKSATLQSEPVEAATPKHDNMSSKLKPELAEPVAAKRQEKSATYQPEPVAAATPKHDNISSKLKQDPVKPVAAKHEDESATLQPEPVEAATAKHSDVEAKLSPEPVEAPAANHGKKETAKQAEEVWNERIKGAYAAVAASTPYRPAAKKPSSNVLSWHRSAQHLPHNLRLCCWHVLGGRDYEPHFHTSVDQTDCVVCSVYRTSTCQQPSSMPGEVMRMLQRSSEVPIQVGATLSIFWGPDRRLKRAA